MITSIFASQPEQLNAGLFSLSAVDGGTTTTATSYYYWIQGLSRGGLNLQTSLGQVTVNIGKKLRLTVNSDVPSGCDTMGIVLSASSTNSPSDAKILGIIWLRNKNQTTKRSFPIVFELSNNDHFVLDGTVTDLTELDSVSAINGMIRFVSDESHFYLYDSEGWFPDSADTIGWISVNGNECYLSSTKTPRPDNYLFGGCDCPIASLVENSSIPTPYGWESGTASNPVKLWCLNEDNPVSNGSFYFNPQVDGDASLGQQILSLTTTITPTNKINKTTGVIDSALTNVPLTYLSGSPFYSLGSTLSPDYALEFEVITEALIGSGQVISFNIVFVENNGVLVANPSLGSNIYPEDTATPANSKFLRALPDKLQKGIGTVQITDSIYCYLFNQTGTQSYSNLVANTDGQIIAINGQQNGRLRIIQSESELLNSEAIRAIVSTVGGVQTASAWSNTISITANSSVTLSFSHPNSIRSDYPDVIAGMSTDFTIDNYIVQLELNGVSYYYSITPLSTPEAITITTTSGASSSAPTVNTDADFGLFSLSSLTVSGNAGVGSLPATTTLRARIFFEYQNASLTISKISHDTADGCIPEQSFLLSEIAGSVGKVQVGLTDTTPNYLGSKLINSTEIVKTVNNSGSNESLSLSPVYWRVPVATKTALKGLSISGLSEGEERVCLENNSPYIYRLVLPSADDNDNYLASTGGTTQGWVKAGGQSGGTNGTDGWNAYATSSQSVTIPAENSTVTVTLATGTTDGMSVGQEWQLTDGTLRVFFEITSLSPLTFRNPTGKGNPSGTLNSGASVNGIKLISGGKGAKGDTGANGTNGVDGVDGADGLTGSVSATSALVFDSSIAPPTTSASEYKAFINSSDSNRFSLRLPSNGTTEGIAFLSDLPDISGKQDTLVSGTNIKTINSESLLGSGNIVITGGSGGGRTILSADRTYYVRTDGNDSNDGLTNTSGGAFLTWAKALTVLSQLDGNGYTGTIKGTGTFATAILVDHNFVGFTKIVLDGDTSTPSNCTLNATGEYQIKVDTLSVPVHIQGIYFAGASTLGLFAGKGDVYISGNCDFGGSVSTHHIYISGQKAQVYQRSSYTISGNCASHLGVYDDGFFDANGGASYTVTIGTRTFTIAFIMAGRGGKALFVNISYSGTNSSVEYNISSPTFVQVVGTNLPGAGGTTSNGGVFIS